MGVRPSHHKEEEFSLAAITRSAQHEFLKKDTLLGELKRRRDGANTTGCLATLPLKSPRGASALSELNKQIDDTTALRDSYSKIVDALSNCPSSQIIASLRKNNHNFQRLIAGTHMLTDKIK